MECGDMRTNDLISVMRLAERTLTADNWHGEAVVMAEAAERLSVLSNRLRKAGLSAEDGEVDEGREPPTQPEPV